ncbi:MAG TPA: hypothetical protein VF898_01115, partial [Chloroflexota bacterium]
MSQPVTVRVTTDDTSAAQPVMPAGSKSSHLWLGCTCALAVVYALLFGWLSLQSYWAYQMHALDMGNMAQAAWNTIHGHPFRFTNMRLPYHGIEAWGT